MTIFGQTSATHVDNLLRRWRAEFENKGDRICNFEILRLENQLEPQMGACAFEKKKDN